MRWPTQRGSNPRQGVLQNPAFLKRARKLGFFACASGFPSTPAVGVRVVATPGADGSLVPLKDAKGLYIWSVDLGGVGNLNTARLPPYARLDLRVTFNPRKVTGRWQIYAEVLNVLNRENANALNYRLAADSGSDRPHLLSFNDNGFPLLPSFGVRYRF